jgi:hypothetical protein
VEKYQIIFILQQILSFLELKENYTLLTRKLEELNSAQKQLILKSLTHHLEITF